MAAGMTGMRRRFCICIRDWPLRINRAITAPARCLGHVAATTAALTQRYCRHTGVIEESLPTGPAPIKIAPRWDVAAPDVWWPGWNGHGPEMSELSVRSVPVKR